MINGIVAQMPKAVAYMSIISAWALSCVWVAHPRPSELTYKAAQLRTTACHILASTKSLTPKTLVVIDTFSECKTKNDRITKINLSSETSQPAGASGRQILHANKLATCFLKRADTLVAESKKSFINRIDRSDFKYAAYGIFLSGAVLLLWRGSHDERQNEKSVRQSLRPGQ